MKLPKVDGSGVMVLRYITQDVDRHGNVRVYFRRAGSPKIRLREALGTDAFLDEYRRALTGETAVKAPKSRVAPAKNGSLRWLMERYFGSPEFKRLKKGNVRRNILEAICTERFSDEKREPCHADKPIAAMEPHHVRRVRDVKATEYPEAANGRVKALRALFSWAVEAGYAKSNPAREVPLLPGDPDGIYTWTIEDVRQFEARHPVGTKARLALDILLLTGVRRSDAVRLGPQLERDGWLVFTETKGAGDKPKHREIPILARLRRTIDATPSGHLAYIITQDEKPYKVGSFGNWFKRKCREAGLPQCSAHGLRKAGATIAAENGATEHQLMAIFGWESPKQAALYTRKADRRRLAGDAMHLLDPVQTPNETVPLSGAVPNGGTKSSVK